MMRLTLGYCKKFVMHIVGAKKLISIATSSIQSPSKYKKSVIAHFFLSVFKEMANLIITPKSRTWEGSHDNVCPIANRAHTHCNGVLKPSTDLEVGRLYLV